MEQTSAPAAGSGVTQDARYRAAIEAIDALARNVRTMRHGSFPAEAKRRMSEILRLSGETADILARALAAAGQGTTGDFGKVDGEA